MLRLTHTEMVRAMRSNDTRYNGQFYVCVKSTMIYCLPSCRARLPQVKNVVFLATREEAIASGFRGCKRCRAADYPDVLPQWFHRVVNAMRNALDEKIDELTLVQLARVDISTIRRHFKQQFHLTPMQFHRKLRLAHARRLMECGENYLGAAFEIGFESVSGFRDAFVKEFGVPPGRIYVTGNDRLQKH